MAQQYLNNIKISDLTLTLNPEQYTQAFTKYGSFKRTISGGIVNMNINDTKLIVKVSGLAQTQIEEIKKRAAVQSYVDFIDYIPIAEAGSQTRTIFEDLGSETIESEIIYLYIPTYRILITNLEQVYGRNMVSFTLSGEEA